MAKKRLQMQKRAKVAPPTPQTEAYRRSLYLKKLLGAVWFDGNLPQSVATQFKLWEHPNYAKMLMVLPGLARQLRHATTKELARRCNAMAVPDWVRD